MTATPTGHAIAATRRPFRARLARLAVLVAVAALIAGIAAVPVAAADVSFGDPKATSTYGTGIDFDQPVVAGGITPKRVEILITQPGFSGPQVTEVPQAGPLATATLHYRLEDGANHIYPNTVVTGQWRIVDADGTPHLGPKVTVTYADTRFAWQTETGSLVRVHWYVGDTSFGKRALAIAEAGIAKAEQLLGVTETEPVDFYVYADQNAFYDALGPGTRENVGGLAVTELRTLFALITPDQINDAWVGTVIPHELTHLVFATAVKNPYHFPPRWLNEGLAVYLSQGYDASDRSMVQGNAKAGTLIPLNGIAGLFPTSYEKFALAYAESVSAVDFLVRTYGQPALVKLITTYAKGVTDDEAFTSAIGLDTTAFNAAWMADLKAVDPTKYGPQAPPIGPLPSGWSSSPAAGAPAPSASSGPIASGAASTAPSASTSSPASAAPAPSGGSPAANATAAPAVTASPAASAVAVAPVSSGSSGPDGRTVAGGLGLLAIVLAGIGGLLILAARRRPATPR